MGALNGMRILGDRALFHPDAVMGPSAATSRIFHAAATDTMPWGPDASLLDLGCGGGALALALWPHAAVRLGADISQRAIRMAAMNRMLNAGLSNEPSPVFAQGNLFAPVAGRRFRRIVCQPPFLPDTGSGSTFSAGGPWGDAITMDILRQLHNHLEPEGRAVLCVEWAASSDHHDGAPLWRSRVRQATAGQPLLGLHCELFRTSAEDYCTLLAPYLHPLGQPAYGNFLRRMLHHYQQQGIEWIDLVVHFFQPALDCPPVQAVRQVPLSALDHVTAQYADRGFQAMRLANAPDPALLAANLLAPAGFRVVALHPHPPPNVTVEFAPESLLAGGHLPLEAVAVLEAASGISGQEVLSMLPGSREENLNLIRQMLLQGLLFAE
jgi:SAM-dependent methyltransferase